MTEPAPFDDFVQRLREAFFALRAVSEGVLVDFDCTPGERSLLQELLQLGPQTVPTLAHARAVTRQAMQKTVDRLIDRAWLRAEVNPRHQRSSLVAVTAAGRQVFTKMRARELALLASVELPVRDAELRRTGETLAALARSFRSIAPNGGRS